MTGPVTVGDLRRSRGRLWLNYRPMECAPKDREIWVVCHGPRGWYGRMAMWDDGRQAFTDEVQCRIEPVGWHDLPALPESSCTPETLQTAFCSGRVWAATIGTATVKCRIDSAGWGEDGEWNITATDLALGEQYVWPLIAFVEWVKAAGAKLDRTYD